MPTTWRLVHHSGQSAPTVDTPSSMASALRQAGEATLAPGEHLDLEHHVRGRWCMVGRRKAGGALLRVVLAVDDPPPPVASYVESLFDRW